MKNLILDNSIKNIKYNKKKYIALGIGMILATFLITTVFTIGYNMKMSDLENCIKNSGDYDFSFADVSDNEYESLKNDEKVDKDSISRVCFNIDNKFNELPKLKVDVLSCDENFFSLMGGPIEIKEGRYPNSDSEIIMENWVANSAEKKIEIGDMVSTKINGEDKEYRVVGIYNSFNTTQYTNKVNFYTVLNRNKLEGEMENILFKLKDEKEVSKSFGKYRNLVGAEHFSANDSVLLHKGEHEKGSNIDSLGTLVFLLVPTTIISIAMIFNILNISLIQRISEFGSFRTLGANKKFITKSILIESLIIGLTTIPVGICVSSMLAKVIGLILNKIGFFSYRIKLSFAYLLIAALVSFVIVIVASLFAAMGINKIDILDAVFTKDKGKDKKSKFKMNFSFEFDISKRSMKRNRKKYYLTLILITLCSLLIFIYFSMGNLFTEVLQHVGEDVKTECNIYSTKDTTGDYEKTYDVLKNVDGVDKVYKDINMIIGNANVNGKELKSITHVYDLERLENSCFEKYLLSGDVNFNSLENENKVLVVKRKDNKDINIGDKINILNSKEEVEVGGFLAHDPFDGINNYDEESKKYTEYEPIIKVVISEKLYKKLTDEKLESFGFDIVLSKGTDKEKTKEELQVNMNKYLSYMRFINYENTLEKREKVKNIVMGVLAIVLVIIGGTSVLMLYNTSKSNVLMREREIAMLQAIGMNSKQVNKTIIYEALIYSIKAGVYSLILGFMFNSFIYKRLSNSILFKWSTPIYIPILVIVIIVVASLIAVIPSIREIKRGSIVEKINIK